VLGLRARGRDDPAARSALDLDGHEADAERLRHGSGDRVQLVAHVLDPLQLAGQPGDHVVRVVAGAEQEPADPAADERPQRAVEECGQQQHDDDDLTLVESVAQRGVGDRQHTEVDGDDERRDETVQQGGPEQVVDAHEPGRTRPIVTATAGTRTIGRK
jgi:hypothetical protein